MRFLRKKEKPKEDQALIDFRARVVKEARKQLARKGIEEVCQDRVDEIVDTDDFDGKVRSIVDDTVAHSWC